MDKYTSDNTVIAAAYNAVTARITTFTPDLCGTFSTWRQRRLFESAMLLAECEAGGDHLASVRNAARRNVDRFRFANYGDP